MGSWAGIVRVSHMGARRSEAEDFHSERDQVKAMQDAVNRLGGTLEILPAELGVSGGRDLEDRPALKAAVEGVERGRYTGIIVAYQSRLTRNPRLEEEIFDRVAKAGGAIHFALDGFDTTTINGTLMRRFKSAINAHAREEHVERFANLRQWATEAGIWQRRQTPTGYRRDPETRRLVPDDRADDVRAAFRARATGASISEIARRMNMTTAGIRHLLANRVYLGELHVGPDINLSAHPPLVSEDEFLAAQSAVGVKPARKNFDAPALLAGLVRCQGCGMAMTRGGNGRAVVYACRGRHSAGYCEAPASIVAHRVDNHVTGIALHALAAFSARPVSDRKALDASRDRLRDAERELAAFLAGVSAAGLDPADFAAAARQRREAVDLAREEVGRAAGRVLPVVDGDPVALWDVLSVEQRSRLLRGLIEAVVVRKVGKGGRVVAVEDRVRVIRRDAGLVAAPLRGGVANVFGPLPFPALDDPAVLGVHLAE